MLPEGFNSNRGSDYTIAPKIEPESQSGLAGYEKLDPTGQFDALNELVRDGVFISGAAELNKSLANSHVFAFLRDKNNPNQATLDLIYPYEFDDASGRPALTMQVFLKMPWQILNQLRGIITQNPDAAEQFYQLATGGLDQFVQRYRSPQLAVVDLDKLIPTERFQDFRMKELGARLTQMVQASPNRLHPDGITYLQFGMPHGVVDRQQIETEKKVKKQLAQAQAREFTQQLTIKPIPANPTKDLDNPSGLEPSSPITQAVNFVMKRFSRKGNESTKS